MKNDNLYLVIIGALQSFEGDGGVIASNQNYSENIDLKSRVWDFDQKFKRFFDNYAQTDNLRQTFFFPNNINNATYYFAIRTQKHFTKFPENNRFYDRREYFFFDFKNEYDRIDFAQSLPDMKDYYERANGTEVFQKKEIKNYLPDTQISKVILSALLNNGTAVKIKNNDNAQDLILNAISIFPACYKKYLGFGFNVKDDSFTNGNLHIFSTFDEEAKDIDKLENPNNQQWNDCVDFLLSNKNKYNDTEILKSEINRETLYKLLDYHKLHYQIDNNVILDTEEKLEEESKEYIKSFVTSENQTDEYIQKRIEKIVSFWILRENWNFYKEHKKLCQKIASTNKKELK